MNLEERRYENGLVLKFVDLSYDQVKILLNTTFDRMFTSEDNWRALKEAFPGIEDFSEEKLHAIRNGIVDFFSKGTTFTRIEEDEQKYDRYYTAMSVYTCLIDSIIFKKGGNV